VERAVSQWRQQARAVGLTRSAIDQFANAFEHPERANAQKAAG